MTVRGFFVPFRDHDGKIYKSYVLRPQNIELWKQTLLDEGKGLRGFLLAARRSLDGLSEEEKLETLGDLITLFFKAPLYREALPGFTRSPYKLLVLWVLLRPRLRTLLPTKTLLDVMEGMEEGLVKYPAAIEILDDIDVSERVERALTLFPVDTRPGPNTTALLPHLMLTSAIAWSLAVRDGYSRRDRAYLRLAALLHDIGKPIDPMRHAKESEKLVRRLLDGILPSDYVEMIVEFVRKHHKADVEVGLIAEADRMASADRLYQIVERTIRASIERLAGGKRFEDVWRSWGFWSKLSDDEIKRLTKEFLDNAHKAVKGVECKPYEDVLLATVDLGGIQESIREAEFLESLAGVSHLIDILQVFQLPAAAQLEVIRENLGWLPLESVFCAGGGTVSFVIPNDERVVRACKEAIKRVGELKPPALKFRFATERLTFPYPLAAEKLAKRIGLDKVALGSEPSEAALVGLEMPCQICYKRPAIEKEPHRGETYYLCRTCLHNLSFAKRYSLRGKWQSIRDPSTGVGPEEALGSWEKVAPRVIEVLAGHKVEDFEEGPPPRLLNLAMVKFDGNMMGSFFAEALSFSEAVERSFRVDLALKKAHAKAIEELGRSVGGESAGWKLRVATGTIYIGGDDGLILLPSWAALPYADTLCREFYLNLGERCTLSVGIVAASPKHSIWPLLEAVDHLLDMAKKRGRELPQGAYGSIAYDVADGGTVTRHSIESRFEALKQERMTIQPIVMAKRDAASPHSFGELVEVVLGERVEGVEFFKMAHELFSLLRDERDEGIARDVKSVKSVLQGLVAMRLEEEEKDRDAVVFTYAVRQNVRLKDDRRRSIYASLARYLVEMIRGNEAPLADIFLMIKLLGGGML